MANSIQRDRTGPDWPLGFVSVANNGTPACLMVNVDPGNLNAPWTPSNSSTSEYTPTCRGFGIQAYHPAAANNGMEPNTGNIYLCRRGAGGSGNRSDPGSIIKVIPPGEDFFFPSDGTGFTMFSPYNYFLDVDVDTEGGLVSLYGMGNP